MFEPAGVIEMEMAHDDGFDVFDVVAGGFDGVGKLHLLSIDRPWEDVGESYTPFLWYAGQDRDPCRPR